MVVIGNFLLVLSLIVVFFLNFGVLAKSPPGGDAGVGYAWSIIILNLAFIILMIMVAGIIGYTGGFEWVSSKKTTRFAIVTCVLLCSLFTMGLISFFRHEPGPVPGLLRLYSYFVPFLIPIVMVVAGFILLNAAWRESVPMSVYKWPLIVLAFFGITGTLAGMAGMMQSSARNQSAALQEAANFKEKNNERNLAEIDSNDVMKNLVFLFVYTSEYQPAHVRDRAVAKIKTHPEWENEIIRLLGTDWAPEPITFLAYNDVEHPEKFTEPVRTGVLNQARLIRESIRKAYHPSHFYTGQFAGEIERVLRMVDRYKGKGVDYKPAVQELLAAFSEPSELDKPKWNATQMVEKWLKKN